MFVCFGWYLGICLSCCVLCGVGIIYIFGVWGCVLGGFGD